MTPTDKPEDFRGLREAVLERILDTVTSIDRNVQEILDHVSDQFDLGYKADWNDTPYDNDHRYE